jgi:anthranilate phosphoribosyltransferase
MSADADFAETLKRLAAGETLDAAGSARAFDEIMSGAVPESQIAEFLTALAEREPTVEEIVGAAKAMRAAMTTIRAPRNAVDLCGTGGDGHGTVNISTAAALVVAACGVPVAKHGNRSASSRTGTADVLEALGVKIDVPPAAAEDCLREVGICFLFAPTYHAAMKHVAPVRKKLGFRTIFNLLGPLSNPARVKRQLMGVFAAEWVDPLARVLKALGSERAWVVHGSDGLDELTITGPSAVAVLESGRVMTRAVTPEEIGIARVPLAALKGGGVEENAASLSALLDGAKGAFRDVVLLNSAAALMVADKAGDLKAGAKRAAEAIDTGAAKDLLARLAAATQKA